MIIVKKYDYEAFDIHGSYINVIIPFNKNRKVINEVSNNSTATRKQTLSEMRHNKSTKAELEIIIGISNTAID